MVSKIYYFILFCIIFFYSGRFEGQVVYENIRKQYEKFGENDSSALKFVNQYISVAKKNQDFIGTADAYEDAIFFSPNSADKLKYADSCISYSIKTNDNGIISRAYLSKGSIYYFNLKQYQNALHEYLTAFGYSNNSSDEYEKNKIIYHIGIIKSYLGYYNEAIQHFQMCQNYFSTGILDSRNSFEKYNNSKGYLNSLHQLAICYRQEKNYKKADSLVNAGINFIGKSKEFPLELAYFTKCNGIMAYYDRNYSKAISELNNALPELKKNNDFAWISVADFYIGKSYMATGKQEDAITQFKKVDSIFQKHFFIMPELRENYDLLIKFSKEKRDEKQELYYTKNLLKADSILAKEFPFLSAKVHKEYDTKILEDAQQDLEHKNNWGIGAICILATTVGGLTYLARKYFLKEKHIQLKYAELEQRLQKEPSSLPTVHYETLPQQSKSILNSQVFAELENKLNQFENSNGFTESGLTLALLADKLKTNTAYLSQYINDTKGVNFNKYLAGLRINFVTQQMYNDPKYLKYSIQGLAELCGMASRQNFSDLFLEINGLRPTDFIKQRRETLKQNTETIPLPTPSA